MLERTALSRFSPTRASSCWLPALLMCAPSPITESSLQISTRQSNLSVRLWLKRKRFARPESDTTIRTDVRIRRLQQEQSRSNCTRARGVIRTSLGGRPLACRWSHCSIHRALQKGGDGQPRRGSDYAYTRSNGGAGCLRQTALQHSQITRRARIAYRRALASNIGSRIAGGIGRSLLAVSTKATDSGDG